MGLKGNCPYKRKGGVWEVSIPNAREEGTRLGRGQQSGKRGYQGGASSFPRPTHPKPHPSYLPYPARELCTEKHRKIVDWREGGRWKEIGAGERMRGKPSPVLPPRGDSHGRGPPNTPPPTQVPPTLGERDMAFPRVSSPLPPGVETEREEEWGDCVLG